MECPATLCLEKETNSVVEHNWQIQMHRCNFWRVALWKTCKTNNAAIVAATLPCKVKRSPCYCTTTWKWTNTRRWLWPLPNLELVNYSMVQYDIRRCTKMHHQSGWLKTSSESGIRQVAAIHYWLHHLSACIKVGAGHFEVFESNIVQTFVHSTIVTC